MGRIVVTTALCALAFGVFGEGTPPVGEAASRRFNSAQVGEAASRRFNVTLTVGTPYRRPALPASLSGITWAGGTRYYAVSDDVFTGEVGLYPMTVELSSNGLSVVSCKIPSPANRIQLADAYDLEAVAFDSVNGTVWAADETRGTVKEYRVPDGNVVRLLSLPFDLWRTRANLGIESLTLSEDGKTLWLCTEEALPCDGPRSSPTAGTSVRLLKYTRATVKDDFTLAGTYHYTTDAWSQAHDFKGKGRRGVSGLCALPDGSLLVLERELSFGGSNPLTAAATARLSFAIYRVDASGGGKEKLASGGGSVLTFGNYEGICLGPPLPNGKRSVLLISDSGDGLSPPMILPLVLSPADAASAIDRSAMSDDYWAIWNDAEQARIDADIEANRKADASVAVDVQDGTEVRYEQLTHDFRFGASTFNFGQLGSPELNRRYEAAFGEGGVFNQGTVPFYWREYEPAPGVIRAFDGEASTEEYWNALPREEAVKERFWRRPPPGKVIDFLKGKGLRVHGHILVTGGLRPEWLYDKFCPEEEKAYLEKLGLPRRETYKAEGKEWEFSQFRGFCTKKLYPKMSEQEIAAALPGWTGAMRRLWTQRVLDIGALFGGKADSWDVVNESSKDFVPYGKSRTGLPVWKSFKGIMPGDFPLVALLDAKRAFPATTELAINDNNINDDFLKQVKDLTAEGARIDLVGCQMHIMRDSYMQSLAAGKKHVNWVGTPKTIRDRLDMMARTGRRIHISEITIPQAGKGEKGLAIQAIAVRNLYRIWFSHKAVAGITWWNLVDGCSFPGEPQISGLFTREMRPKPAYDVLNALVNGEWKSKGAVSAKGGKVAFRGFRGRYRLSWKDADGKTVSKTVKVK